METETNRLIPVLLIRTTQLEFQDSHAVHLFAKKAKERYRVHEYNYKSLNTKERDVGSRIWSPPKRPLKIQLFSRPKLELNLKL